MAGMMLDLYSWNLLQKWLNLPDIPVFMFAARDDFPKFVSYDCLDYVCKTSCQLDDRFIEVVLTADPIEIRIIRHIFKSAFALSPLKDARCFFFHFALGHPSDSALASEKLLGIATIRRNGTDFSTGIKRDYEGVSDFILNSKHTSADYANQHLSIIDIADDILRAKKDAGSSYLGGTMYSAVRKLSSTFADLASNAEHGADMAQMLSNITDYLEHNHLYYRDIRKIQNQDHMDECCFTLDEQTRTVPALIHPREPILVARSLMINRDCSIQLICKSGSRHVTLPFEHIIALTFPVLFPNGPPLQSQVRFSSRKQRRYFFHILGPVTEASRGDYFDIYGI
jgi:hypothetical protein